MLVNAQEHDVVVLDCDLGWWRDQCVCGGGVFSVYVVLRCVPGCALSVDIKVYLNIYNMFLGG